MTLFFYALTIIGSFFTAYKPVFFSSNIIPLQTVRKKHGIFLVGVSVSMYWIWYSAPGPNYEYMELGMELLLLQLAVIDGYSRIIPNRLLILGLSIAVLERFNTEQTLYMWTIIGLICMAIFSFQWMYSSVFKKRAFGWGDIKLAWVVTIFYGAEVLFIFWMTIVTAGLFAALLLIKDRKNRSAIIPLSPFLVLSVLVISENNISEVILLLNAFLALD